MQKPERTYSDDDYLLGVQCGFIEAAEWADAPIDDIDDEGNQVDGYVEGNGFEEDSEKRLDALVTAFFKKHRDYIMNEAAKEYRPEFFGHDLYLTSQHHGVGFWDRGLGELGDKLTELAAELPDLYIFVDGTSGQLYVDGA